VAIQQFLRLPELVNPGPQMFGSSGVTALQPRARHYSTHENWDWGSRTQTIDDYYKSQPKWMM
jgi:hypothetical protein